MKLELRLISSAVAVINRAKRLLRGACSLALATQTNFGPDLSCFRYVPGLLLVFSLGMSGGCRGSEESLPSVDDEEEGVGDVVIPSDKPGLTAIFESGGRYYDSDTGRTWEVIVAGDETLVMIFLGEQLRMMTLHSKHGPIYRFSDFVEGDGPREFEQVEVLEDGTRALVKYILGNGFRMRKIVERVVRDDEGQIDTLVTEVYWNYGFEDWQLINRFSIPWIMAVE